METCSELLLTCAVQFFIILLEQRMNRKLSSLTHWRIHFNRKQLSMTTELVKYSEKFKQHNWLLKGQFAHFRLMLMNAKVKTSFRNKNHKKCHELLSAFNLLRVLRASKKFFAAGLFTLRQFNQQQKTTKKTHRNIFFFVSSFFWFSCS